MTNLVYDERYAAETQAAERRRKPSAARSTRLYILTAISRGHPARHVSWAEPDIRLSRSPLAERRAAHAPQHEVRLRPSQTMPAAGRRTIVAASSAMQMTVGPSRSSYGPLPRSRIACARQWNVASAYTAGLRSTPTASARTHDDHGDDGEETGADPTDAIAEIEQRERQAGENDGEVEPLATSAQPGARAACRRGRSARWRRRPGPDQHRAWKEQDRRTFGSTLTGSAMPGLVRRAAGVARRTLVGAGALQQRLSRHLARRCDQEQREVETARATRQAACVDEGLEGARARFAVGEAWVAVGRCTRTGEGSTARLATARCRVVWRTGDAEEPNAR